MNVILEKIIEIIKQILEIIFNRPDEESNFVTINDENIITADKNTFFVKERL